jgi:hypothetical protein
MLVLVTKLSLNEHGQVLWAPGSLRLLGFLDNQHIHVTRLPALRTGRSYSQKISLVPIKSMKILITPSGIEPATFWLVARCPNQLPHRHLLVLIQIQVNEFLYYKWKNYNNNNNKKRNENSSCDILRTTEGESVVDGN